MERAIKSPLFGLGAPITQLRLPRNLLADHLGRFSPLAYERYIELI